jgi:hypothetical protein
MKTLSVTIFLCSFFTNYIFAQIGTGSVTDQKITAKIKELKTRKIDTILNYCVYCNGRPPRFVVNDSCYAYDIKYLFWIDHGKCFMQRFDECKNHQEKQTKTSLRNLIHNRYKGLFEAQIKKPKYIKLIEGKKMSYTIVYDHSCYSIFQFIIGDNILKKEFDNFDLDSKYDNKHLNLNYDYNQKSILNTLRAIVENDIKNYTE